MKRKSLREFEKKEAEVYSEMDKLAQNNPHHPAYAIAQQFGSLQNYRNCILQAQGVVNKLWIERKLNNEKC